MTKQRVSWPALIEHAAEIVESYDTGVTLRQLFYRLVSTQLLPNDRGAYTMLSRHTAEARRNGEFPDLIDRRTKIARPHSFESVGEALRDILGWYQLDRTTGQDVSIYLGVEKAGLVEQLESWFGDLGVPILALGGYASQSYADRIAEDVDDVGRPAVLLYAGDLDPSGEDIERDFVKRTDCWAKVLRVALTVEQVDAYALPENFGKTTDSRAAEFAAKYGRLVQVEVDALPPETLRALYQQAIDQFWDADAYRDVLAREKVDRSRLQAWIRATGVNR